MGVGCIPHTSRSWNNRLSDLARGRRTRNADRARTRCYNNLLLVYAPCADFLRRIWNENVASAANPTNSTLRSVNGGHRILLELWWSGSSERKILLELRQSPHLGRLTKQGRANHPSDMIHSKLVTQDPRAITPSSYENHLLSLAFSRVLIISLFEIIPTRRLGLALSTIVILPSPVLYIWSRIS